MKVIVFIIGSFFLLWGILLMKWNGFYPIELTKILTGLAFIILSFDRKKEVKK